MKRARLSQASVLDICAIAGVGGIGVSVWLIYWQLTFGVVGALLLVGAVHGAWRKVRTQTKRREP